MREFSLILLLCLCGCTGTLDKKFTVQVDCYNCITPYGKGEHVSLKIDRCFNYERLGVQK